MNSTKPLAKLALSALAVAALTLGATDSLADHDHDGDGKGGGKGAGATIHGVNFQFKTALDESFCVEASLATGQEGREVYISKCAGKDNQHWTFTDGADGSNIIVGHLGMCLDIRGRKTGDGTPVQIWRCHYGQNQRFTVTPSGRVKEVQSGKCLTVGKVAGEHKPVYIDECDEQAKQQTWRLVQ
jgi:hypothetical protein